MTTSNLDSNGGDTPEEWPDDEKFRSAERLKKRPQFLRARRNGWRQQGRRVIVYVVANDAGHPRLGVTVSRRVGNAVVRNRWKRRLREIFRRGKHHFGDSHDVVIIAKAGAELPPFDQLREDVYQTVRRAVGSYRDRRSTR